MGKLVEQPVAEKAGSDPETWVEEHGDYLFKYAYVRLRNKATAEDVVQEALLAGIKGLKRFDGKSNVRYWLLGILKHKVVDYIRKASRETVMEDPEAAELTNSSTFKLFGIPSERASSWQFNPRKAFEQKEFRDVFTECMTGLKGNMQQAFAMKELEGLPTEEICKVLSVTPNNLWVMLHRCRQQLKVCLETNWISKNRGVTN
jgi:RNA polymerase sigma-70 factor (ECF subfamily)